MGNSDSREVGGCIIEGELVFEESMSWSVGLFRGEAESSGALMAGASTTFVYFFLFVRPFLS